MNSPGPKREHAYVSYDEQVTWAALIAGAVNLQQQHLVSQILKGNRHPQEAIALDRIQGTANRMWKAVSNSEVK